MLKQLRNEGLKPCPVALKGKRWLCFLRMKQIISLESNLKTGIRYSAK